MIGDVHGAFDTADAAWLDRAELDAVLFVGDLQARWSAAAPSCAPAMASLRTPAWWIPGNHDGVGVAQLVAEVVGPAPVARRLAVGLADKVRTVAAAVAPVRLLAWDAAALGAAVVIGARPCTLGGPELAFAVALEAGWGIGSMEASAARLEALVRAAPPDAPLILLAHNGPAGLGGTRDAPFGRDFRSPAVDWGDPDLAAALASARNGRRPVVVVAGHMHHALRGGGRRRAVVSDGDAVVVNCAVVPRIRRDGRRHHVQLTLRGGTIEVDEVWVGPDGVADRRRIGRAAVEEWPGSSR